MKKNKQPLTQLQRQFLFVGCSATARELGVDASEYRHQIMKEELGIEHLSDCGRTEDFDNLMRRVFADRGEYSRAMDFVGGNVRRLQYLAVEAAKEIVRRGHSYLAGAHY